MTVTGTDTPSSLKIRVIPLFLPINPIAIGLPNLSVLPAAIKTACGLSPLFLCLKEED
jgi:hypothetical protein